jgi:hypothetical protein
MSIGYRNNGKMMHVGGTNYIRIPFQKEEELERLAVEHKDVLFGKDALYFDMKR